MFERVSRWIAGDRSRRRIVLAEDDPDLRGLIADALRRDGHEVVEAADGVGLLTYLGAATKGEDGLMMPDLVLSDVRMPGYSGLDILAALREVGVRVPVVLITAFGDREAHALAFELDATMVDKPFEMDALRLTINCLVR